MNLPTAALTGMWVVLVALGVLVFLVYRQLGYLLDVRGRGHEQAQLLRGLDIGTLLPPLEGTLVSHGHGAPFTLRTGGPGMRTLLMFADPLCGSCELGVTALNAMADALAAAGVEAVIATVEELRFVQAVPAFAASSIPVVIVDHGVRDEFRVRATPLFYVADDQGRVLASGAPHTEHGIRDLLRRAERTAPSFAMHEIPVISSSQ